MTTSASGNPLGPQVNNTPAKVPPPTSIKGHHITLESRDASHFDDLYDVLGGEENKVLWDYIPNGPFLSREEFHTALTSRLETPNTIIYTIVSNKSRKAIGSIALINIDTANRTIEIGYVLFSKHIQRTVAATEVTYLLLCLVFDDLGYRRCEWKCDNLNGPSKRAAQRLGFQFEGIFKQHMIIKGRNRDTAWYAMMDWEWPSLREGYERWLNYSNFDASGRQLKSLLEIRVERIRAPTPDS